jgi:hypothetical protein
MEKIFLIALLVLDKLTNKEQTHRQTNNNKKEQTHTYKEFILLFLIYFMITKQR